MGGLAFKLLFFNSAYHSLFSFSFFASGVCFFCFFFSVFSSSSFSFASKNVNKTKGICDKRGFSTFVHMVF